MNLYRTLYRPAHFSALPDGVRWRYVEAPWEGVHRPDLRRSTHRFGVIDLDRPLTEDECKRFELQPV
jgi:hypothetical protein